MGRQICANKKIEGCHGLIEYRSVGWSQPPAGVKRRHHGVRRTGQTPAVEELDHPQEAEGNMFSSISYLALEFRSGRLCNFII